MARSSSKLAAAVRVVEASGRRGMARFLDLPRRLYPRSSPWVAPLDLERRKFFDPARNPFFERARMELFLAVDAAGRDVGRIAAIENPRHNEFHGENVGFFGFFESVDDVAVARVLLDTASRRAAERGRPRIRGPVNPSTNHECGLLVEGFERSPMVQTPYNHAYYEKLLLEAGCEGVQDLVALLYEVDGKVPERLRRGLEVLGKRHGFSLRHLDMKRFDEELAKVKLIYNEAFARNYGFVPLSDAELDYLAGDLRQIVAPELCVLAEVDGEPAGFSLALPDVNQALKPLRGRLLPLGWWKLWRGWRRIDGMRAFAMGIRPRFRKMGIDYAFYHGGLMEAQRRGIREIEVSWVLAHNVELIRPVERFGGRIYKRYRLYEKSTA
jgi:GNAT superfamily N-acetyltransferase